MMHTAMAIDHLDHTVEVLLCVDEVVVHVVAIHLDLHTLRVKMITITTIRGHQLLILQEAVEVEVVLMEARLMEEVVAEAVVEVGVEVEDEVTVEEKVGLIVNQVKTIDLMRERSIQMPKC